MREGYNPAMEDAAKAEQARLAAEAMEADRLAAEAEAQKQARAENPLAEASEDEIEEGLKGLE